MAITKTYIGTIEEGIDGSDAYWLVKSDEGDMTPEQASDWMLSQYHCRSSQPGGYFCTTVRATQVQYSYNEVICVVCHRYDV